MTLLLTSVRRLVEEVLIPAEARIDAEARVPEDIVDAMRQMGLFGLSVPERYGGSKHAVTNDRTMAYSRGTDVTGTAYCHVFATK